MTMHGETKSGASSPSLTSVSDPTSDSEPDSADESSELLIDWTIDDRLLDEFLAEEDGDHMGKFNYNFGLSQVGMGFLKLVKYKRRFSTVLR